MSSYFNNKTIMALFLIPAGAAMLGVAYRVYTTYTAPVEEKKKETKDEWVFIDNAATPQTETVEPPVTEENEKPKLESPRKSPRIKQKKRPPTKVEPDVLFDQIPQSDEVKLTEPEPIIEEKPMVKKPVQNKSIGVPQAGMNLNQILAQKKNLKAVQKSEDDVWKNVF
jgi:hypothetical protein